MNRHFQGFYFKQASRAHAVAFIGAISRGSQGAATASLQVVLPDGALCASYPAEGAKIDPRGPSLAIGPNRLDASGLVIDMEDGGRSVRGSLSFGPLARPGGDIMGPFRFLPRMECRHHLVSMIHQVRGQLCIDGQAQDYSDALGYIEGDSGRSFPARYLWTHCFCPSGEPRSLMLSVAEIPWMGLCFTGVVGVILLGGRPIRLATYLGARVRHVGDGRVVVEQGKYRLTAQFAREASTPLRAPVDGGMSRAVGECLVGLARYQMTAGSRVLFDFTSDRASFEYEYDR